MEETKIKSIDHSCAGCVPFDLTYCIMNKLDYKNTIDVVQSVHQRLSHVPLIVLHRLIRQLKSAWLKSALPLLCLLFVDVLDGAAAAQEWNDDLKKQIAAGHTQDWSEPVDKQVVEV